MELLDSLMYMVGEMSPYILLGFLIAGIMHAFVPQTTFARHLSSKGWKAVLKAAAIGVPLPLCSCGVLPTAIGMRRKGASRAASTSFLIATPQTGADSIAATWSLLGPAFAILRPIAALITAVFGGVAVGKGETDDEVASCSGDACHVDDAEEEGNKSFASKCLLALRYGFIDLVGSIGGWLVGGLVIAALITVYVPADFFAAVGSTPIVTMVMVLIIAIPMYVCATGSIPIAMSLMLKGLSPGTAFVLLMAGPAANFASFSLISREMGRKAAVTYLISIIIGAVAFGLAIDYLMPSAWFDLTGGLNSACCTEHDPGLFTNICSAILVVLLAIGLIKGHKHHHINSTEKTMEYIVKGMNCPHCQQAVAKAISGVNGVENVDVDLKNGRASVVGTHDPQEVINAVHNAGFTAELDE